LPGVRTQLAFVAIDEHGEPTYELYGEPEQTTVPAVGPRLQELVRGSDALFLNSNTLAGRDERALTMKARALALDLGQPVVFDCNLRLHRWSSRADAAASANACVPGALLVRANQPEAELMTGESDPERAALALRKAGAAMVVITLGPGGALLRGSLRADAPAVPVRMHSTVGAGDALTGTLLARLALSGFYPPAVAAGLRDAVAAAAQACERWGAVD
jgi:fructokinase